MITVYNNKNEFSKKVDSSFLISGRITIPNENIGMFLQEKELKVGEKRNINIIFNDDEYEIILRNVNRKKGNVFQLQWDSNKKLQIELKKEFIQSYIAIMSDKYQQAMKSSKKFRTNLSGGVQEVVKIIDIGINRFELKTFLKIDSPYSNLFQKLVENNVFAWIDQNKEDNHIISKETTWYDISELKQHEDIKYVVYYLIDDKKKEIYIGSAKRLGDRVKPNRNEIPGWNKFRYEIINPQYNDLLKEIEYHSIVNFGRFIKNNKLRSFDVSNYKLVNKDYGYYRQ